MKKIRVKYCKYNTSDETTPLTHNYKLHNILKKYYDVEVTDDKPDYIFCDESSREYLNYDGIRICYTGENITPNFNMYDYAFGIDWMEFGDRYYRFPPYYIATFYTKDEIEATKDIDLEHPKPVTREDLAKKTGFCAFVYSNYLADERRKVLFDKLSDYKQVDAGGKYLNNIGGKRTDNKLKFESERKFAMAVENSCRDGYTTDRLINAIIANTVPIYWGNPVINKEFNTKRFVNCHEYKNFDEVVARVKEIDQNDDLFLQIVNEPVFAPDYTFRKTEAEFEAWLRNIFDQPYEDAKRRTINEGKAKEYEANERLVAKYMKAKRKAKVFAAKIYQPFKKMKFLEKAKETYLRKKLK